MPPVIGIDTESDSFYSYQEKVCLIQLSDHRADYIIDPLAVEDLSGLGPILANPDVVKILHGADYDVVCLKRDYGFEFHNIFDTMIAAQMLGLAAHRARRPHRDATSASTIDKQYQRHDWSKRPLLPAHIEYARGDTHWLLALREILVRRLEAKGRMRHMVEECGLIEKREWQGREWDPEGFVKMKNTKGLDQRAMRVLRHLWAYRDGEARKLDRPVFKVIPDSVLIKLAREQPKDRKSLDAKLQGKSALKRRHAAGLLDAVQTGLEDEREVKPPKKESRKATRPKGPKARLRGKQAERALAELKAWRNHVIDTQPDASPFTGGQQRHPPADRARPPPRPRRARRHSGCAAVAGGRLRRGHPEGPAEGRPAIATPRGRPSTRCTSGCTW